MGAFGKQGVAGNFRAAPKGEDGGNGGKTRRLEQNPRHGGQRPSSPRCKATREPAPVTPTPERVPIPVVGEGQGGELEHLEDHPGAGHRVPPPCGRWGGGILWFGKYTRRIQRNRG